MNGGGYAFRGHFAFWMNFFVFSVPVLLLPRISPRWRGAGAAVWLAVLGGSVIEVTQLFVRTDTAPFRFDVDAILLRVARGGSVLAYRQDTRRQKSCWHVCFSRSGWDLLPPGSARAALALSYLSPHRRGRVCPARACSGQAPLRGKATRADMESTPTSGLSRRNGCYVERPEGRPPYKPPDKLSTTPCRACEAPAAPLQTQNAAVAAMVGSSGALRFILC